MELTFDTSERDHTLKARGLDFADAAELFAGHHFTLMDTRQDYGEDRYITVGTLKGRMVNYCMDPTRRCPAHHFHGESQ